MGVALRQSAAVLLYRDRKVWLGQRGATRFLPGFWVFPGGACETDEEHESAARREVQEETGLLLTGPLQPLDRAITPAYALVRFDTRIYAYEVGPTEEPVADAQELRQGRWFDIAEILQLRDCGEVQLAPPTYRQLLAWRDIVEGHASWPTAEQAFAQPPMWQQEVLPLADGITVVPLESGAMPPAAWTNAVIVGKQKLIVVDPGGPDPETLLAELNRRKAEGAEILGVVLTHHHPDHLAGYPALQLQHLPLWCHQITAPLLPEGFPEPTLLQDGETLHLEPGIRMVAHWTPGHAPGHLSLEIPERKTLLAADLVSSLSSIVIPSSNGDLIAYLDSLNRMRELNCSLTIPAHGPPYGEGGDPFGTAIAHRAERERQVLACLRQAAEPQTLDSLTETLYRGLDSRLMPAARANVGHHLKKLAAEGKAQLHDDLWELKS